MKKLDVVPLSPFFLKGDGKVLTQKLDICSFVEEDFLYPMVYA
jgi:hypothetical protein